MTAMEAALQMISDKVIAVREDGTVWKLRNLNATPLPAPRRVETRSKRGYLAVKVWAGGRQHIVAAHRLVWTVLFGPIPHGLDINHIDGNKSNNAPANLEIVTRSDNHRHAYRTNLRNVSTVMPKAVLSPEFVDRAKALRAKGMTFAAIGETLGVSKTTAYRAATTPPTSTRS